MADGSALGGIYPFVHAFFNAHGGIDVPLMRRQVRACLAGGAHGMACLGLATAVAKLSPAERLEVLALVAEGVAGREPLAVIVFARSQHSSPSSIERPRRVRPG